MSTKSIEPELAHHTRPGHHGRSANLGRRIAAGIVALAAIGRVALAVGAMGSSPARGTLVPGACGSGKVMVRSEWRHAATTQRGIIKRLARAVSVILGGLIVLGLATPARAETPPTFDDSPTGGPSCQISVSPTAAHWGGELKLTPQHPTRFGAKIGTVKLHRSRNPKMLASSLAVGSWHDGSITVRLPAAPPDAETKEYFVSVTRAAKSTPCGFISLASKDNVIESLQLPACVFTTTPVNTPWGETVILTATLGANLSDFGAGTGTIKLHSLDNTASATMTQVQWQSADTISVVLPQTRPSHLPDALAYDLSVTRAGAADPCGFAPIAILPACALTAQPTTVEWGQRVTLTATLASVGADFGSTEGSVRLVSGASSVHLAGASWGSNQIVVPLPAARPPELLDAVTYNITVTRAGADAPCGTTPLAVALVIPCAVTPFLIPVNWGQTIVLTALLGQAGVADFGSRQGTVDLVKDDQSVNIPATSWAADTITATLPDAPPDGLPRALTYQLTVTRGGAKTPCVAVAVTIIPVCSEVGDLLKQGWAVSDGTGDPLPFGAPTVAPFALGPTDVSPHFQVVQRAVPDNPLLESLTTPDTGIGIRFGFFAPTGTQPYDFSVQKGQMSFGDFLPSLDLQVLPHPEVLPAFGEAPQVKEWTITVKAEATVPGCPLTLVDLPIEFQQLPLVIPTIGAFFQDLDFGGDVLVVVDADDSMLPAGLGLPARGTFVDAKTGDPDGQRALLLGAMGGLVEDLDLLAGAFDHVPADVRRLPPLAQVKSLADLRDLLQDGRSVAVDVRGDQTDLHEVYAHWGFWPWEKKSFARSLSSAMILGAPDRAGIYAEGGHWSSETCGSDPHCDSWSWRVLGTTYEVPGPKDLKNSVVRWLPALGEYSPYLSWNDYFERLMPRRY